MSIKDDDDFIDDVKKVVHSYASSGVDKECAKILLSMLDAAREALKNLKKCMMEERWLQRTEENKSFIIEVTINDGLREDCSFGRRPWKIGEVKG
jgi:hypothetical protein